MLPAIRRPTLTDVAKLIFVGAIWGGAFIFVTIALNDFGPVSIATWRVSLGTVVMLFIAMLIGQKFPRDLATGAIYLSSDVSIAQFHSS